MAALSRPCPGGHETLSTCREGRARIDLCRRRPSRSLPPVRSQLAECRSIRREHRGSFEPEGHSLLVLVSPPSGTIVVRPRMQGVVETVGCIASLSSPKASEFAWGGRCWSQARFSSVVAVIWVHYSSFPRTRIENGVAVPVVVDYFNWIPRGWFWKSLGFLAAFAASQLHAGRVPLWPGSWVRR